MSLARMPFFGLVTNRQPMTRLPEHYAVILEGASLIEDQLACYISGGSTCTELQELTKRIDALEDKADKIKRSIRNHLPRSLFMPVDKTLFFNYTRSQDNILDDGQDALNWLLMRTVNVPEELQKGLVDLVAQVVQTVRRLGPALSDVVDQVQGKHVDRAGTKEKIRAVQRQHRAARQAHSDVARQIFNTEMDFKDLYQLDRFAWGLYSMSHNTEGCADLLRAMIAK